MSTPESDPNEQANISGADFAIMCDELTTLRARVAELEAQKAAPATMAVPEGWQDIISDVVSNIGEASNDLRTQDQALYVSGQLDRLLMLLNPLSTQPQAAQAVPEGFYLASFKDGRSRGFVTWWGPNRCGYTPYLEQAGVYTAEEAADIANEYTVIVPAKFVSQFTVSAVDTGHEKSAPFHSPEILRAAILSTTEGRSNG